MNYYEKNRDAFLEGLKTFLRIPSISTLPEHKPDIRRAAEFTLGELRGAGLQNADLIEGEGNPLVYAEWLGAPGKPTLLFYGHYDVQPPDPLEEWKSPPFEPDVRGEDIFARGASDDKGQVYISIKAVEGFLKTAGRLPVNVKFLIEGEEEVGGEHIEAYVSSKPARLKADAAVISDTEMFAPDLPTLCVGLRGIVYLDLEVRGAGHDLHSGVYGGAAPNPIQAIAEILCALKDRDGHILIPGFPRPYPPAQSRGARGLGPSAVRRGGVQAQGDGSTGTGWRAGDPAVRASVGPADPGGPRHPRRLHRRRRQDRDPGARHREDQHAAGRGPVATGSAGAVPRGGCPASCPRGVTAEVKLIHMAAPSLVNPNNPFIRASADAMRHVFGKETVYIRSGGSIPIVGLFDQHLGIPSVLMGFGLPDDNLHAPNEKFHLPNFYRGIEAVAAYLELLGQ